MSIRRIESAYATFFGDERLSSRDMSILVALAYIANEKEGEACFPSQSYLSKMSHFSESIVGNACNRLRELKVIDWISGGKSRQGGNINNRYRFLFPHCKMQSRRERYQQLDEPPTLPEMVPTPPDGVPYPVREGTLPRQKGSNTEGTPNRTSESKPQDRGVVQLSDFEFKFEPGVVDKSGKESEELKKRENLSLVDEAMRVCGVDGPENKRSFSSAMLTKKPSDCLEEIMTFESEIRQGEHAKAKKLAAILMNRLKALP